jgi:pyridoxine 5-phosphate synthase
MTKLSVNLNKVALLRNQRDCGYPSVLKTAELVIQSGAHGITVHPRPDERHIRKSDVPELADFVSRHPSIEYNIEGYPSADFIDMVCSVKCHQVTLVPDAPDQKTSDHGWNVDKHFDFLCDVVGRIQSSGARVSLFIDPTPDMALRAADTGAKRVELYTGLYFDGSVGLAAYRSTADTAAERGLGINAGHDLNLDNLKAFIQAVPHCAEVSIGHAITSDALIMGWPTAVKEYLNRLQK